ncbi:FxsA family protein [Selenihalanaerobacter shriftii]|uniref:UPF0716 protein FxsA n=1 Tax=Selenihalanaerobacter shriftii TaxID=142842 RepID=A0A1T4Q177_9FIRM|nr:FxsA family protein [Selenihalanaerobacter shriftii]SJZ97346.1 UPF0716 protein FxsA [Selenihalanaerobacter shriftii]
MFAKLLLLFTVVPMIELTLLIKLGGYVGFLPTVGLVALTGVIGVSIARSQGFLVINKIRSSLSTGQLPADSLIDGLLILIGGAMLLTPGLLTDVTGFSLVIPTTRKSIRKIVKEKFSKQIKKGNVSFSFFDSSNQNQKKKHYQTQDWEESQEQDEEWDGVSESIDVEYEEINEN